MYKRDQFCTSDHSSGTSGSFSQRFENTKSLEAGDGAGVAEAVGTGATVWVGVGDGVGEAIGTGFGSATPLFQTNFFPLFTHVYFLPLYVEVAPAFEHLLPGVTAATDS